MILSNTLEEKAAFDRFSDLMAKMMIKQAWTYGPETKEGTAHRSHTVFC